MGCCLPSHWMRGETSTLLKLLGKFRIACCGFAYVNSDYQKLAANYTNEERKLFVFVRG